MTVYAVIKKYDNGDWYEERYTTTETIKLFSTREKAIKYIQAIQFKGECTEGDNEDCYVYSASDEETIRTIYVKNEKRMSEKEIYQYAIKEMEVL